MFYMKAYPERSDLNRGVFFELEGRRRRDGEGGVCVCVCGVCVCVCVVCVCV